MALHLSGKMMTLGLVIVALITAFSAPREFATVAPVVPLAPDALELHIEARIEVLDEPLRDAPHPAVVKGPLTTPTLVVRATAYNSLESQTNAQPFITATGARTRWGIIAVSRDLLGDDLPYGSLVRLTDLGNFLTGRGAGAYQTLLDGADVFIVEDTMHPRKTGQIDLWFADYASAVNWGVRRVEVELVRYGRDGPLLDQYVAQSDFYVDPSWLALR